MVLPIPQTKDKPHCLTSKEYKCQISCISKKIFSYTEPATID